MKDKVISKLDLSSGYLQYKLDQASSLLCSMNTSLKWKWLPFGLKVSYKIFRKKLRQVLLGVASNSDDTVVYGSGVSITIDEANKNHNVNLKCLLLRYQFDKLIEQLAIFLLF